MFVYWFVCICRPAPTRTTSASNKRKAEMPAAGQRTKVASFARLNDKVEKLEAEKAMLVDKAGMY